MAESSQSGPLKENELPFIVGADVDGRGGPTSFSCGLVDEIRLSAGAVITDVSGVERDASRSNDFGLCDAAEFAFRSDGCATGYSKMHEI